jgi:hypothetical protein|eukprot:COSAG01_NODE_1406_length_10435_cov_24.133017_5_plen_205_part_00
MEGRDGVPYPPCIMHAACVAAASNPMEEGDTDSDEEIDVFAEDSAEDLARQAALAARAHAHNAAVRAAVPPAGERTAAEARRLYMLKGELRRVVATLPAVLSPSECARLCTAAEGAAAVRGGWHARRHSAYPTTDLPLDELEPAVVQLVRARVTEQVLAPTAAARGFRPQHLCDRLPSPLSPHPFFRHPCPIETSAVSANWSGD